MEQADSIPRAVVGTKVPAASCGFTGTHSRGGRHGHAYPRIVAAYLHGRVRRRRYVRRNPAPLKAEVAIGARADVPARVSPWTGGHGIILMVQVLHMDRRDPTVACKARTRNVVARIPLKVRTDFR